MELMVGICMVLGVVLYFFCILIEINRDVYLLRVFYVLWG